MRTNLEERLQEIKKESSADPVPQVAAQESTQVALQSAVFSFVNPTELVDLPSKGKLYPEGHPLKGKESVEIRQMTAKEEDILTNKSFIRKGIVVDRLIESLLVDKTIPISSLLVGDKTAIMIAARITAYGAGYPIGLVCTSCGAKSEQLIDLNETQTMTTDAIDELAKANPLYKHGRMENGNIVFQLPKTKWFVECRLLTGEEEKKLLTFLEAKRKTDPTAEIALSEQLMLIVESINTVYERDKVVEAIKLMPAGDAKHLRDVYQKLVPTIKLVKKYTCGSCENEQEVDVPFTQEFFWPK